MSKTAVIKRLLGFQAVPGADKVVPVEVFTPLSDRHVQVVSTSVNIASIGVTKSSLYSRIADQQQGNDDHLVDTIPALSTKRVGQVFKAMSDNLSNIKMSVGISNVHVYDVDFEEYANDAALQAVWVPTNGAVVLDQAVFVSFTQSAKLTVAAAADSFLDRTIVSTDLSLVTSILVHVRADSTVPTVSIRVTDSLAATSVSAEQPVLFVDTWQQISVDLATFSGAANLADIVKITIYVTGAVAGDVLHFDNVKLTTSFQLDDTFDRYADDAALIAEWVPTVPPGGNGEALILGSGYSSIKSMKFFMADNKNSIVVARRSADVPPLSMTEYVAVEFWFRATGKLKQFESIKFRIDDGSVVPPSFTILLSEVNTWVKVRVPFAVLTSVPILGSVVAVEFEVNSGDGPADVEIDEVTFVRDPGAIQVQLVEFGPTLPVDSDLLPPLTTWDSAFTEANVDINVSKTRLLFVPGLTKGLRWVTGASPPTRVRDNLLTVGNYYGFLISAPNLTFGRLDIYGSSGALAGGSFYDGGFAFSVAPAATTITVSDPGDCLFFISEADHDVAIVGFSARFDAEPGLDALLFVGVEDPSVARYSAVLSSSMYPGSTGVFGSSLDLGELFELKPHGFPIELYYQADPSDLVTKVSFSLVYAWK